MNCRPYWLIASLLVQLPIARSDELMDIAGRYKKIVADYQRIWDTQDLAARHSATRLVRDAYRLIILQAANAEKLSADDLYALGACHEGVGEPEEAKQRYTQSLEKSELARTHLGLVRVNLNRDMPAAERHFAASIKLDPEYPGLGQFRVYLAAAYQKERKWVDAVRHLERYLGYTKSLVDRQPGNETILATHLAVADQLDRMRMLAGLMGEAAPAIEATHWIQGEPLDFEKLEGKVVLVDFCAVWTDESKSRMELLQKLHDEFTDDGLVVVGLTMLHRRRWDDRRDRFSYDSRLTPEEECASVAEYAKKHGFTYRLAVIDEAISNRFGVGELPHSVLMNKESGIELILLKDEQNGKEQIEKDVKLQLGVEQ